MSTSGAMSTSGPHSCSFRKPIVSMNKILRTKSVTGSHSRSIFISGAAGSGKSTLCEKLVYDWSRDINDVTNITSYELVFLIKVANLQKGGPNVIPAQLYVNFIAD